MVKANFGHSDFKLKCAVSLRERLFLLILENTLKTELSLDSFSEVVSYGHVPANGHHIPCCCLLSVCTACACSGIFFSIKLKRQKSSSRLQHVCKQVTLSPFPSSCQSFNDRSFQYKCM